MKTSTFAMLALALALPAGAQEGAVFAPKQDSMLETIKTGLGRKPSDPGKRRMWVDFTKVDAPRDLSEFHALWHTPPVRQGLSDMCWCFSTTSFLESEIHRLTGREIRLSSLHTVYWEHVEKVRNYVRLKGAVPLNDEGSEQDAVLRIWEKYGVVPADAYTGLTGGRTEHDQDPALYLALHACLEGVKAAGVWDEETVVAMVRGILDHHLGPPPATVNVDGQVLTPKDYLAQVVRLDPRDYVALLSCMEKPYWTRVEYEVPDNWRHSKDFVNVPLDAFLDALRGALKAGFTVAIAGDFTEPGYSIGPPGIAIVPSWDIPTDLIDERARQLRFESGSTSDDHGQHVVGTARHAGRDWFLVKDSWSSAWNNGHPGYYFFREDFVKLKTLCYMVHKDAIPAIMAKIH